MSLKLRVHEKCKRCGQREARKVADRVFVLAHHCPDGPPGPRSAPRSFHASEVVFETGEFDVEVLRNELEEAWSLIEDLRDKRWRAEESATAAVKAAMRSVYDPGRPVPSHGSGGGSAHG